VTSRAFGRVFKDSVTILKEKGCEIIESACPRALKETEMIGLVPGMDAIVVGTDEVTAKVIKVADKLKIIAKHGVGVNNIDIEAASKRGIIVTFTPEANTNAVADLTFGLIICLARPICKANQSVKSGKWERMIGTEVWGKRLGVVGVGKIGKEVIKRAKGFNMEILAYDIYKDEKLVNKFKVQYVSLRKLLRESDFITLHLPLTLKTRKLIGEKEIKLMKRSSYVVNTARGEIMDERALYLALKEKRIAGAAVDVYTEEPPKDSPLLKLDNIITTPHLGAYTFEALRRMGLMVVEDVLRVLNNEQPLHSVNSVNIRQWS
jgi:D-3-phosphoglycerate dehydrogenase